MGVVQLGERCREKGTVSATHLHHDAQRFDFATPTLGPSSQGGGKTIAPYALKNRNVAMRKVGISTAPDHSM